LTEEAVRTLLPVHPHGFYLSDHLSLIPHHHQSQCSPLVSSLAEFYALIMGWPCSI